MLPQQGPSHALANHRLPETLEMAVLETFHFDDGNNQMSPQTTLPADEKTPAQKPPMKPIFPEINFFSAPPVPQKIGVIEVQKPQRAVFKNTQPAPELAASRMPTKTVRLDSNTELAQGKMRVTKPAPELAASSMRINTVKIDADTKLAPGKMPVTGEQKTDKT